MKSKPIILIIILVSWMAKAEAATYYVAMSGSNSNSGSIDSPWQTITYAVGSSSGVQPGDTILVRAGNYPETVNPGVSGIPGSPIVLMNYPGETVTLDPGRLRIDNGDDYWKFDGLRISNSSSNGLYVSGTHPNGFLTVSNCEFVSCSNNGIELGGPDFGGITIEDCLIELNGTVTEGHGIIMYGGVGVVWLHRNWIINNEGKGITHATEADWKRIVPSLIPIILSTIWHLELIGGAIIPISQTITYPGMVCATLRMMNGAIRALRWIIMPLEIW